jgi:hypothetical protein
MLLLVIQSKDSQVEDLGRQIARQQAGHGVIDMAPIGVYLVESRAR